MCNPFVWVVWICSKSTHLYLEHFSLASAPVAVCMQSSPESQWAVLEGCQPVKLLTLANEDDAVIVNADRLGYYRVKYSPKLRGRLLEAVSSEPEDRSDFGVSPVDLAGMLDDAYHLARAGLQDFNAFMNLTLALGESQDNGCLRHLSTEIVFKNLIAQCPD